MSLTTEKIQELASRKGVRRIAVENFLSTLGTLSRFEATQNLYMDAAAYNWNAATITAIREGIELGCRNRK